MPKELQLATLVAAPPEGPDWLHEQKFDGYRILAEIAKRKVRLLSRRMKDWTAEFPTIARALAELPVARVTLDGEVCVLMPDGRTSFQALQSAIGAERPPANLVYFAFDLLALDGEDIAALPLEQRKARLQAIIPAGGALRYSDHVVGNGAAFFALACESGLEGIVSKRRDKPYQPGRGMAWQKTKCIQRQELVIGGFTDPEGARIGIGALLVGYYEGERFVYAGKVGTGFDHATLAELRRLLEPIAQKASPFDPAPPRAWTGPCHWVAPRYVAEVAFLEWTSEGRLRHPSFQGLRRDKDPKTIVRELPG
jgi:bifunctional non-homologous end joining protein LigD